ncbi:AraC family transcriptional regulator [Arachidicoccus ginsenosidimutans]|uniref:AraC family transcriptional regulator n=1 Tax=Arachidicoccus sp. BS20 TaxID=1850526 RepID=UPI0007F0743C|nr:AraC family transcriptional regulator [Arachidicoccus sp. BS20]ANI89100.1 AraC family transcriptional regulator [Arachidicoccus sp. BS20]
MKVLQFTIPVQQDKTIVAREDILPYFYPYLHKHKEMQITWVQQGDGTLVANNNMHLFQNNDVFVIGADLPHVFKSTSSYFIKESNKHIRSLDIFFDPDVICDSLLNIPELRNLRTFLKNAQNGFRVPKEMAHKVSAKMLHIKELDNGLVRTLQFIELLQILASVDSPEKLSADISSSFNNENDGIRISHIYNYIMRNYERDITLEEVARQAYMTPQAFCRYFKKHTRHTFVSFLNEIRINEARKQLSTGNYESISGVAYNCGFNSISNFNRVFKSITQQAPTDYVETLKNGVEQENFEYGGSLTNYALY